MVIFKSGVKLNRFTPAIRHMLDELVQIERSPTVRPLLPEDLVVTSVYRKPGVRFSRHATDEALDLRSHSFNSRADKLAFRRVLEIRLGLKFRVIYECTLYHPDGSIRRGEHFHCQVRKGQTYE